MPSIASSSPVCLWEIGTHAATPEGGSYATVAHQSHHRLPAGDQDGTALEMAFSKKKIEERKAWLRAYEPGTFLDHTAEEITYHDFVNKVCALSHTCLQAAITLWRQPCVQEQ